MFTNFILLSEKKVLATAKHNTDIDSSSWGIHFNGLSKVGPLKNFLTIWNRLKYCRLHSASDEMTWGNWVGISLMSIKFLTSKNDLLLRPISIQWWYHNIVSELLFKGTVHASVYVCCLVLYFWSEPHLLIISYEQSISLMLATATKVVKFQSLFTQNHERVIKKNRKYVFAYQEVYMKKIFLGHVAYTFWRIKSCCIYVRPLQI